ncbi:CLUMA_CG021171, isoform A [Clunio marinus]|uniref:CLUMA_CG021171, isoform A n=1 Tax=Clunio marinus TaxID=568069 RepID=A0A1J1J9M3_9DIPT|nr:CLUMA_CG021171, isoform A [Clunio marinus]
MFLFHVYAQENVNLSTLAVMILKRREREKKTTNLRKKINKKLQGILRKTTCFSRILFALCLKKALKAQEASANI